MIPIKTTKEIKKMEEACSIAACLLETLCETVKAGMSTYELDLIAADLIKKSNSTSACLGYKIDNISYPSNICISVNEEVVHGIGKPKHILKRHDLVSLDVCINHNGFIGDNACSLIIDKDNSSRKANHLIWTAEKALEAGINQAVVGNRIGDISFAIQSFVEKNGFSVIKEFVGHGIGTSMHEEPQVPNYGQKGKGPILKAGMIIAIEPMINLGSPEIYYAEDKFTVITKDHLLSAHAEHTVLIREEGPKILTFSKKREKMLEQI